MKTIKSIFLSLLLLTAVVRTKAQTTTASTSINNLLTAYLDLKNALVASDNAAAQAKAKVLHDDVTAVQANTLPADQQTIWKSYVDKLSFDSRHISESTDISHQREHFASLSKNMYDVVKAFKANTTVIYWQYCPMKKSSWLSDKPAIENPYYGKEMLDCGSVKETLKAAN
jgi:hypothetical protein